MKLSQRAYEHARQLIVRVAREPDCCAVLVGEHAHGRLGEVFLGVVSRMSSATPHARSSSSGRVRPPAPRDPHHSPVRTVIRPESAACLRA